MSPSDRRTVEWTRFHWMTLTRTRSTLRRGSRTDVAFIISLPLLLVAVGLATSISSHNWLTAVTTLIVATALFSAFYFALISASVIVTPTELIVVNPLRRYRVPRASIVTLFSSLHDNVGKVWLADGQSVKMSAVDVTYSLLRGNIVAIQGVSDIEDMSRDLPAEPSTGIVTSRPRYGNILLFLVAVGCLVAFTALFVAHKNI